jgi:hypothetical protein
MGGALIDETEQIAEYVNISLVLPWAGSYDIAG